MCVRHTRDFTYYLAVKTARIYKAVYDITGAIDREWANPRGPLHCSLSYAPAALPRLTCAPVAFETEPPTHLLAPPPRRQENEFEWWW